MSVILFSRREVYQELADAYEGLKHLQDFSEGKNDKFYKSLRRLYFANVATFLCQYHDGTPLLEEELKGIETFAEIEGHPEKGKSSLFYAFQFLYLWGRLKYNLSTNDGEFYEAREAFAYIQELALTIG